MFKKSGSFFWYFWRRDLDLAVSWDKFGFEQGNPDELDTSDLVDVVSHQLRVVEFHVPAENESLECDNKDHISNLLRFEIWFIYKEKKEKGTVAKDKKESTRIVKDLVENPVLFFKKNLWEFVF